LGFLSIAAYIHNQQWHSLAGCQRNK